MITELTSGIVVRGGDGARWYYLGAGEYRRVPDLLYAEVGDRIAITTSYAVTERAPVVTVAIAAAQGDGDPGNNDNEDDGA